MSEPASQSRNAATLASRPPFCYGFDLFTCHVVDWRLWLADLPRYTKPEAPRALHFTDNWTRQ